MKRKILALLFIVTASSVFAIPKGPCDKKDVCCEDPAPGPFAFSYPKDVGLSCPRDFYAEGSFLWMKPSQEGLDYAILNTNSDTSYSFPLITGDVKGFSSGSQEWDWRPGFRVNFGFYSNHDIWNFEVVWTYIKIKADSSVSHSGTGVLLPLMLPPANATIISLKDASERWTGDYNTMDLNIGKPHHTSRYFISHPFFGLRSAWIDQDIHARYSLLDSFNNGINFFHKNDYWSIGLRAGFEGQFILSSNWFLYGKTAFALLFGKFDITESLKLPGFTHQDINYADSFYNTQPNAEISFGISWKRFFNKNQSQFSLKVGYEFMHWWNQNRLRRYFNTTTPMGSDITSNGDLSFNGFQFALHFEF